MKDWESVVVRGVGEIPPPRAFLRLQFAGLLDKYFGKVKLPFPVNPCNKHPTNKGPTTPNVLPHFKLLLQPFNAFPISRQDET